MASLKAQLKEHKEQLEESVSAQLKQNKAELQEAFSKQREELKAAFSTLRAEQETLLADWQRRLLALQHGQQQYASSSLTSRLDSLEKQLQQYTSSSLSSASTSTKASSEHGARGDAPTTFSEAALRSASAGDFAREEHPMVRIEKDVGSLREHFSLSREPSVRNLRDEFSADVADEGAAADDHDGPGLVALDEGNRHVARDYFREARSLSSLREKLSAELSEIRAASPHFATRGSIATLSSTTLQQIQSPTSQHSLSKSNSVPEQSPRPASSAVQPCPHGRSSSVGSTGSAPPEPSPRGHTASSTPRFRAMLPNAGQPDAGPRHTVGVGRPSAPIMLRRSLPTQRPTATMFTPPQSPAHSPSAALRATRTGTPTVVRLR